MTALELTATNWAGQQVAWAGLTRGTEMAEAIELAAGWVSNDDDIALVEIFDETGDQLRVIDLESPEARAGLLRQL